WPLILNMNYLLAKWLRITKKITAAASAHACKGAVPAPAVADGISRAALRIPECARPCLTNGPYASRADARNAHV
ncbi:MAG: hypothetical protein OXK17_03940, partial [Thaumarchaeota archaeon]|nr:hypothetical protein [Nitrososphaerota archaeon]